MYMFNDFLSMIYLLPSSPGREEAERDGDVAVRRRMSLVQCSIN